MWGFVWNLCILEAADTLGEGNIRPNEAARQAVWPPELKRARTKGNEMRGSVGVLCEDLGGAGALMWSERWQTSWETTQDCGERRGKRISVIWAK